MIRALRVLLDTQLVFGYPPVASVRLIQTKKKTKMAARYLQLMLGKE